MSLIVLAVVGIAVGSFFWTVAPRLRRPRLTRGEVSDHNVTTLEWFAADEVGRVRGVVVATGEPLIAPLSRRPCVGYDVSVTESLDDAAKELLSESRWTPFLLDDGTGRAVVDPTVAPVTWVVGEIVTTSGALDDATPEEVELLARFHERPTGALGFNRSLIYRERALVIGELVSVRGYGVREPDPSPRATSLSRGAPPSRIRLVTTPRTTLAISNHPTDLND